MTTIYIDTLNWSDITQVCGLTTELDLSSDFDFITKFKVVSIEHMQRMRLVMINLELALFLTFRPFTPELVMGLEFELRYFKFVLHLNVIAIVVRWVSLLLKERISRFSVEAKRTK